jgi:hypothetical protein
MNTNENDLSSFILQRRQPQAGQLFQVLPDGRFAFWFDHSTSSTFTECQEKFHLKNIQFAPLTLRRKGPGGSAMNIGSWWSKVSETFYKQIAAAQQFNSNQGAGSLAEEHPKLPTIQDIILIAAKAWVSEGMDSLQLSQPDKYDKFAIPVPAGQLGKYFPASQSGNPDMDELFIGMYHQEAKQLRAEAASIRDKFCDSSLHEMMLIANEKDIQAMKLEQRTSLALGPILMAADYYQSFALQDMRDWRILAAEQPFGRHGEVVVGETNEVVVYWMGKPDLVIYEDKTGIVAPLDQKTKDYIRSDVQNIWKPHSQTAGYIFSIGQICKELGFDGALVDRCIISVCGRLRPAEPKKKGDSPKPRFIRVRPHYAVEEIAEWRQGILWMAEQMRSSIQTGHWTRNDKACHLYAGCDYRGICSRPEGVRPLVIQSDYELKEPWSPFEDED